MEGVFANCLTSEIARIGTFQGWPGQDNHNVPVRPTSFNLAKAGFYYSGLSDVVCCFSCGLRVQDWEHHQDPFVVHATRNPECPFIKGQDSSNKIVMIPSEREYAAIQAMLKQAGQRVQSTAKGQTFSSSSLISETLKSLYGESMLPSVTPAHSRPVPEILAPSTSPGRSSGNRSSGKTSKSSSSKSSSGSGRSQLTPSQGSHSRRSSSTSDANESNAIRPNFHRTSSYNTSGQNPFQTSETIPNRQTSNPVLDHAHFQDSEDARVATFENWAGFRNMSAREFAQAGFIYIGAPDRVQCVFCNGILRNWNASDIPLDEHKKHFPRCSFVNECLSAAITVSKPRHPQYRTQPSRLSSFENWPLDRIPKPEDLAKAGFFYVGHGDSVKCYYCDGGLRNWEDDDDPWREHARWFPNCSYVKQAKGKAYIDAVVKQTDLTDYQTASVVKGQTELKTVASQQQTSGRSVDPREVTARMDSNIVKTVLKMDIPRKLLKQAIKNRLAENGDDFSSSEALLEAVFNLDLNSIEEEEEEEAGEEAVAEKGIAEGAGPPSGSEQDSSRLAEENRLLKEQRQCKICMDDEACVAFLPCGHLVCCSNCAPALSQCPICRGKIRSFVRTFLS